LGANIAPRRLAHILGAVDDLQVPAGDILLVDRFRRGIGRLYSPEQHRPLHQHFAAVADLHFDVGRRQADGVELHAAVGLQARVRAGLRRTVELLQVDADRSVEAEKVGPIAAPAV
jgi:hypothetical protein